ncbi:MAG: sulfatase-like hydrolase/transferase [Opitutales bacterium]|nr:sulfatase-like hydrolase/transferase [Opitutales bacterium]
MKPTILLLLSVFLGCAICSANDDKPNVLFIAVDDMNDWNGVLKGNLHSKTPHMEKLASKAMVFTNAHFAAPASEKLFKMGESAIVYRLTLCAHLCLLIARSETSKR